MTPDLQTLADAYVYLLGRALVVRQEKRDLEEAGVEYNVIKYNPLGTADFVNPNLDVAYLEAWFAVDDRSVVLLHVPEIRGRYYTVQILDEWGEVIVNINERTFPSRPWGTFALVEPGYAGPITDGATRISLHSRKAKMLARVELRGDADGAVELQRKFAMEVQGSPVIATPPRIPAIDNRRLVGVELFENTEAVMASALDVCPLAAEMQQKVRATAAWALANRVTVDSMLAEKIIPRFIGDVFMPPAASRNHWTGGASTGNYGRDFRLRTAVNYAGIWANVGDEAMYFVASCDAAGQPLNGSLTYALHFAADSLPQSVVNAYWSVILVGLPDLRVVPNSLHRYNLNNCSPLVLAPDGSLTLHIQPDPPKEPANWLPSPPEKPFTLTYRTYVPKDVVRKGEWWPPPVRRAAEGLSVAEPDL